MNAIKDIQTLERLNESILAERQNKILITVSGGTCGFARGAGEVFGALREEIKKARLLKKTILKLTGCQGFCQMEPLVLIYPEKILYCNVKPEDAREIVRETIRKGNTVERLLYEDPRTQEKIICQRHVPFYEKQHTHVLGMNDQIDPTSMEDYIASGGYKALARVLTGMQPWDVIDEIKRSLLRGRGGAGFPTGYKWDFCRRAQGEPKYIVCNADEGDPGAYMDRSIIEGNPHRVIEGMIIGGYAIGAAEGYVYVRNEYPLAVKHVTLAVEKAKEYGFLGENILGSGFDFEITISRGAGAFVCGEETALIASIEGCVGEPRQRPPFPVRKGLWGKPTNINNVETWANVPNIINKGAKWFATLGTRKSKGTKIFSLVGKISNTGLVEVPMGMKLREIVFDIGGGIPRGKAFKAVQTGGPSGGCIPKEFLDLPVDYERLAQVGSIMGSGGMIVMDEDTCMVDVAKYFLGFLQDESCGKCFSCRVGIKKMLEVVTDITEGRGRPGDIELLQELGTTVRNVSQCGLGQTAANPVLSTIRFFRKEYEEHIRYKRCRAYVCNHIIGAPCQHACPIGTEVPVYVSLIAHGRFREALDVIRKDNPLPAVCGRVCHHPCEMHCRAGEEGDPIAIRALKRFVTDTGADEGEAPARPRAEHNGKKVAIVGSGPAGISAAYFLAKEGYRVTLFEKQPVIGGMLAVGIPDYRLPKDVLKSDMDRILAAGFTVRTNTALGRDITIDGLFESGFEAVFLAIGAHKSMRLSISGEKSEGVLPSMGFLTALNLGQEPKLGKKVVVIGGGNSAVDSARAAIRMPAVEKVSIIYRRTRAEMPAFEEEVNAALEEGVDIQYLAAPISIQTEENRIKSVQCLRMTLGAVDASGRRRPIPIEGSDFFVETDTLISAIGEQPDLSFLTDKSGIQVLRGNTIFVDPETLATSRQGVFAGGDAVPGDRTVIDAIAMGKRAVDSIHRYLRGESLERTYDVTRPCMYVEPLTLAEEELFVTKRSEAPQLSPDEREKNFREVELGYEKERAMAEARRCLRCDLLSRSKDNG
jgi:NADH-quinone oxidoreductase subunit F